MTKSELRHKLSPSEAVEDYLKTIYLLREEAQARGESGRVTTNALAERLGVEPGSVTGMLKKLAAERKGAPQLVRHTPYHGVELTEVGEKLALEIVRHHRLLELYLTRVLGFRWDEVHEQADELEHVISEEFEEKIDHMLGEPVADPHGDPIPTRAGELPQQTGLVALADLEPGHVARICRVRDQNPGTAAPSGDAAPAAGDGGDGAGARAIWRAAAPARCGASGAASRCRWRRGGRWCGHG